MLQTLALAAALSLAPAQNGALAISNERITFGGMFGPSRPNNQLLPGDIFFLVFDIENLSLSPDGSAEYSIGMEIVDAAGKAVFTTPAANQQARLPLGGTKLPGNAYYGVSTKQAKGTLTCRVTVTDKTTKATAKVEKSFEVLAPAFGVVGLTVCYDPEAKVQAPLFGVSGQPLWFHFGVVGFARDPQTKQPNVAVELRAYDQAGKPLTAQPYADSVSSKVAEADEGLVFPINVPLNRVGSFTVEIKAECKISGKSYKMSFPVSVMAAPK